MGDAEMHTGFSPPGTAGNKTATESSGSYTLPMPPEKTRAVDTALEHDGTCPVTTVVRTGVAAVAAPGVRQERTRERRAIVSQSCAVGACAYGSPSACVNRVRELAW